MTHYRTNRSIVQCVSGNAIIPTYWKVSGWIPGCVTCFVIILSLQECTNNGFRVSTTE